MPADAKQAGGSSKNVQQMSLDEKRFSTTKKKKISTNFDRKSFFNNKIHFEVDPNGKSLETTQRVEKNTRRMASSHRHRYRHQSGVELSTISSQRRSWRVRKCLQKMRIRTIRRHRRFSIINKVHRIHRQLLSTMI